MVARGLFLALLFTIGASLGAFRFDGAGASSQEATPASSLCQIEPRTQAEIDALTAVKTNERHEQVSTEGAVAAPPAIVEGIERTWKEFVACGDDGDFLRMMSLVTDECIANLSWSDSSVDESGNPVHVTYVGVYDVQLLADGRVGAIVAADATDAPSPVEPLYVVFQLVGDRWLIDDVPLFFSVSIDFDIEPGSATPIA